TDNTQREVIDDKYPILLIPGLKVAETIRAITLRDGISVDEFLKRIDKEYESRLQDREPEQVLSM
ncbi:MAG: restriction endonuclease, partial [Acidimicrobiaceae bacterium]|nr:restriction endonuclease [Acidimicrobiaceae bacterium]